jgi:hypothetical protein
VLRQDHRSTAKEAVIGRTATRQRESRPLDGRALDNGMSREQLVGRFDAPRSPSADERELPSANVDAAARPSPDWP